MFCWSLSEPPKVCDFWFWIGVGVLPSQHILVLNLPLVIFYISYALVCMMYSIPIILIINYDIHAVIVDTYKITYRWDKRSFVVCSEKYQREITYTLA